MVLSIFEDKLIPPSDQDLQVTLGATYSLWYEIKDFVIQQYPGAEEEWKHGGKNYGWGFRLKDKKRVIVYMTPCEGSFLVSLVLGEKATEKARRSELSPAIKTIIESAKVYAEGRGFRMEIHEQSMIADIKQLIAIKIRV